MDYNPYTPPQAKAEASIPREAAPRPIAVWLLIVFLLAFALLLLVAAVQVVGMVASHWSEMGNPGLMAISLGWRLGLIAIFFAAAYGAYRRHRWSRWFGVALLVAFAAISIFKPDTTQYANNAEHAGGQLGHFVILPALLAWWT